MDQDLTTDPAGEDPPDPGLTEEDTQRLPDLPPKWHREIQDTADVIDRTATDPHPREITDPADPSWVQPAADAVPVAPRSLLPAGTLLPDPPPSGTVGTSLPAAPDTYPDDPERDPEGHA